MEKLSNYAPQMLSVLRIVSAFMFIPSGTAKMFGWPVASPGGVPEPMTQIWFGAWIEIIGGLLLLIGLFTRPTAFLLSGTMAVAYWQFHWAKDRIFWPSVNGGVPAALFCFVFLYFVFSGPGPWSVDAKMKKG